MANVHRRVAAGAVEFVESASRQRAAGYRERAADLKTMAQSEPNRKRRAQLAALADQYWELAVRLEKQAPEDGMPQAPPGADRPPLRGAIDR